jgi:hypothetical protein
VNLLRTFGMACLFLFASLTRADEGMWLLNQPPRELLLKTQGFDLTDPWLERAMKASIRFNNGGSGSFVSPHGLCVTNHHIGADTLQKLSTKEKDLHHDGFLAKKLEDELKCPDLELNVLQEIVDVTKDVQAAVAPDMPPAEAAAARRAVIAKITSDSLKKTGLRSDVVTLYQGGVHHLYRYKKYTDVRLVMAPEYGVAFFGGDSDNFEYPRYNLDVCFFRVYENGKPAVTPHHFKWSPTGPKDGELVFVSGHPGTTNRLETLAHLKHRRDVTLPYTLQSLRYREALLQQYGDKGPEQRRHAQRDLFPVANARKALTGQYQGLLDPQILKTKETRENDLLVQAKANSAALHDQAAKALATIDAAHAKLAAWEKTYALLEKGDAFDSRLFRIARHLVRLADELPKEDGQRLAEYRSSGIESLKFQLFSPAPIPLDLDRAKLGASLSFVAEQLGGASKEVKLVLGGKSPAQLATDLVAGSKLGDVAVRKELFETGAKGIAASADAMIRYVRDLDAACRALRKDHDEIAETLQQAYGDLAKIRFQLYGSSVPPDATFTLRLAYGVVKGYEVDGEKLSHATTFGQMFARAAEQGNRDPFELPKSWADAKAKLKLDTPFNFTSTADTIGGNSGSPVLNRAGELVGINFDRNRHGLVRNFVYTDHQARHISVHSRAVLEALRAVYAAESLAEELVGKGCCED